MAIHPMPLVARPSRTLRLTWLLTLGVAVVTVENIWLDPWLTAHVNGFPSLVPEPPEPLWIFTFAAIGIVCTVLLIGQILLIRRPGVSTSAKVMAGTATFIALVLSILWFRVTSGIAQAPRLAFADSPHSVKLTWNASTSPNVAGYLVFRYDLPNGPRTPLNSDANLIHDLKFKDPGVVSGHSYKYVAQAVDAKGNHSPDSTPATVTIP